MAPSRLTRDRTGLPAGLFLAAGGLLVVPARISAVSAEILVAVSAIAASSFFTFSHASRSSRSSGAGGRSSR